MKRSFLLLFILLFNNHILSQNFWQQTYGPYGGAIIGSIVTNGINFFGATADSVYLSTDNGMNWKEVNSGLLHNPAPLLTRTIIYPGSNRGSVNTGIFAGIYRTKNNGASWESINGDHGPQTPITSLGFIDTIIIAGSNKYKI
jgi:photosystem II stability/assembly factor-like uncharacterized protein